MTSLLQKLPFKVSKTSNGAEIDPDGDSIDPYETRPTKPVTQLAFRIGLWVAVGFGCVGGILALLGLSSREGDTVVVTGEASEAEVPAPVASVAERAVEAWLSPNEVDEGLLEILFVEPPERFGNDASVLALGPVSVISGGQWEEGYWLVTLAVDVYECVPDSEDDADFTDDDANFDGSVASAASSVEELIDCEGSADDENGNDDELGELDDDEGVESDGDLVGHASTWFVEVGVAGDIGDRVAALSTPAIVGAPPAVSDAWQSTGREAAAPEAGEPIAQTVERFLNAWLAGDGEMSRYLAPGVESELVDPAPFSSLTLAEIAYDELEEGHVRTRAHMQATTTGGVQLEVAYEVEVIFSDDRWEVSAYWGAPTLVARPVEEEPEEGEPAEQEADDGGDFELDGEL